MKRRLIPNNKFNSVILLLIFSVFLEFIILFNHLNLLKLKAANGTPSLSFAVVPGTVQPGQNFDLLLNVNPNNVSFNAFELNISYDPTKVEFQNTSNLSLNIGSYYPLITASVDTTNNIITVVGAKVGSPFSGSNGTMLALVKMKAKSGASGNMNFSWLSNTNLGQKIAKESLNASFQIGGGVPGGGPDFNIAIPGAAYNVQRGQNLDVQVFLKTASSQVQSVDFILPYDDARLSFQNLTDLSQNIEINPSSGFNTQFVIKKVEPAAKKIFIGLVAPIVNQAPVPVSSSTDILLATIKFAVKPDAPLGNFDLLPDTTSTIYNVQTEKVISCVGGVHMTILVGPSQTPIPTPTPTIGSNPARLRFKLQFPDITSTNIQSSKVSVELKDGSRSVGITSINLVRNGNYFQSSPDASFLISENKAYTVLVKTDIGLRRVFSGVYLTQSQILDCTVVSNSACGELISQRDNKLLFSGDSDGFNTASGSFNKVDSADLQVLATYYNQASAGQASFADFNLDNQVNIGDLEILGKNYGKNGDL